MPRRSASCWRTALLTDAVVAAGKGLGQSGASPADDGPELFVRIELCDPACDRDSMPAAGLHRRAHPLGDGARLGAGESRQYQQQLVAAPVNRQVGLANRPDQRFGDAVQELVFDLSLG